MAKTLAAFKAYDIRGHVPDQLNPALAYWLGHGYAAQVPAGARVVLGMDSRLSSPLILAALAKGLADAGAQPFSMGLCGTEEVYAAVGPTEGDECFALGLMVTASHNPASDNGIKAIFSGGVPFVAENMARLKAFVEPLMNKPVPDLSGYVVERAPDLRTAYVRRLMSFIDPAAFVTLNKPFKLVINAGNGAAGPTADAVIDALKAILPLPELLEVVRVHHEPDGRFLNGVPNPLLPSGRKTTARAIIEHNADLGVAWDGDFDRCFMFDETGGYVSPYYIVGLLAEEMLAHAPGDCVVHDCRLFWDTKDSITKAGGVPVACKTGHVHFKAKMRATGAVFGGESSAHMYFRDFWCCDSGMLPWLLLLQYLVKRDEQVSQAVSQRVNVAPALDETNFRLAGPAEPLLESVMKAFPEAETNCMDGLEICLPAQGWRANLRTSNTEPLLRLNMEATSVAILEQAYASMLALLLSLGAVLNDDSTH